MMAGYSLAEIRRSLKQKREWERQFPLSYWVVRPISLYLAYPILLVTVSPSRIALGGLCVGLISCLLFTLIPYVSIWPAVIFLVLYDFIDAVDGTVARITGNVTFYGKFLDAVIGQIIEGSYALCLGWGLYRDQTEGPAVSTFLLWSYHPNVFLIAAMVITVGKYYSSLIQSSYYSYAQVTEPGTASFKESLTSDVQTSTFRHNVLYLIFENIDTFDVQVLLLILASAFSLLNIFLAFYAIYYSTRLAVFTGFYYHRANRILESREAAGSDSAVRS